MTEIKHRIEKKGGYRRFEQFELSTNDRRWAVFQTAASPREKEFYSEHGPTSKIKIIFICKQPENNNRAAGIRSHGSQRFHDAPKCRAGFRLPVPALLHHFVDCFGTLAWFFQPVTSVNVDQDFVVRQPSVRSAACHYDESSECAHVSITEVACYRTERTFVHRPPF